MKLRSRGSRAASRYVTVNGTCLESQDAQAAAEDPYIQDILRRQSISESILSSRLGQDYDGLGTEGSPCPACSQVRRSWRKWQIQPPVKQTPHKLQLLFPLKKQLLSRHCPISQPRKKYCQKQPKRFKLLLRILIHGELDRKKKGMAGCTNCP